MWAPEVLGAPSTDLPNGSVDLHILFHLILTRTVQRWFLSPFFRWVTKARKMKWLIRSYTASGRAQVSYTHSQFLQQSYGTKAQPNDSCCICQKLKHHKYTCIYAYRNIHTYTCRNTLNFFNRLRYNSYDRIHPFEVYNSVVFSVFRVVTAITTLNFRTFHQPRKKPHYPLAVTLYSPTYFSLALCNH